MAKAKAEGLEYAYIIRNSPALMGMMNVYKVSLKDGKEELARNAFYDQINFKTFKKILGASDQYVAHNLSAPEFQNLNQTGGGGSYIVPEAILLEELELKSVQLPTLKEEEYVTNPLIQGK